VSLRRISSKNFSAKYHADAEKSFANHQIVERTDRSWRLHRPYKDGHPGWDSTSWFEVTVFWNGTMLVHGDIDFVMFGHYGRWKNAESVVRWLGATKDFDWYVSQKARIGMGIADSVLVSRDDDVFFHDMLDHIEANYLDGSSFPELSGSLSEVAKTVRDHLQKEGAELPEWLEEALNDVLLGEEAEAVIRSFESASDSWESGAQGWGEVPSCRLVYAYQALRRLVQLLDAEHAATAEARKESVGDGG
jgi:hypothetical protein